jgi:hypothetical protein
MVCEGASRNTSGETGFDLKGADPILIFVDRYSGRICMLVSSLSFGDVDSQVEDFSSSSGGFHPAVMV